MHDTFIQCFIISRPGRWRIGSFPNNKIATTLAHFENYWPFCFVLSSSEKLTWACGFYIRFLPLVVLYRVFPLPFVKCINHFFQIRQLHFHMVFIRHSREPLTWFDENSIFILPISPLFFKGFSVWKKVPKNSKCKDQLHPCKLCLSNEPMTHGYDTGIVSDALIRHSLKNVRYNTLYIYVYKT